MCQTIFEESVYSLSNEHRKIRKSRYSSPIYVVTFLCTVLVTLPILGQICYEFDDSRTLHTNAYILYDQLFLIHSTLFLLQCNRITRTHLYL